MSKRRIECIKRGGIETRVHYDDDWQEFTVTLYQFGRADHRATYYTDDETDARQTAQAMANHGRPTGRVMM